MLTAAEIINIINECRTAAKIGLNNGTKAIINEISVDFIKPPSDFLGTHSNPAIFINENTYKYLHKYHKSWIVNQTIAIKIDIFAYPKITVIGILVHETGHAFNIAAAISNTESNAYLFEIEILTKWFNIQHPILSGISEKELLAYLEARVPYYKKGMEENSDLHALVKKIELNTILNKKPAFKYTHSDKFFPKKQTHCETQLTDQESIAHSLEPI